MATRIGSVKVDAVKLMKETYVIVKMTHVRRAYLRLRLARIVFEIGRRIGGYSAVVFQREK